MNEFLRTFVKKTILGMIGAVPEYQVRLYAVGWFEKGVLTEADLAEIELLLTPAEQTEETAEPELSESAPQESMEG